MQDIPSHSLDDLPEPLAHLARQHLKADERVVTWLYLPRTTRPQLRGFVARRHRDSAQVPARAFILTVRRALILEDPTDDAASMIDQQHLRGSCRLDSILMLAVRSYLLDCALTLTAAERGAIPTLTIEYDGTIHGAFWRRIRYVRAVIDGRDPLVEMRIGAVAPNHHRGDWFQALDQEGMHWKHYVSQSLAANETVQKWLVIPTIDRRRYLHKLVRADREYPPGLLIRSDRQVLYIKQARRIADEGPRFGADISLIPMVNLKQVRLIVEEGINWLELELQRSGATVTARIPVTDELAQRSHELVAGDPA